MIQANELRIGNYVGINLNEFPNNYFKVLEIGNIMKLAENEHEQDFFFYADIEPVPLSPEILEKCGFRNNRNGEPSIEIYDIATHLELMQGKDNGVVYYFPSFTQTPQGDEERTVYFNRIQHLHQLQNLYYALTDQELKINI